MTVWKLGCRWGEKRKGTPSFYDFIKDKQIVIGVAGSVYQENDLVFITDGFPGLAIAKVIGAPQSVLEQPDLEEDFDELWIEYNKRIFTYPVIWYELPKTAGLWYPKVGGICQINPDRQKSLINAIIRYYNDFEKMQQVNETAALLKAKGQIILQGPPGTGKTRLAKQIAEHLAPDSACRELIQFHPAYAYEDFVRGIVAETTDGSISYRAENKVLGEFAARAAADKGRDYVLIIDEINRANLPSVLGELIYALEYRGEEVDSVYGLGAERNRKLVLPENLLIIGTMNKADRSVGHLDYAIRRRFAFVPVLPDESVVEEGPARRLFGQVQELMAQYGSSEFDLNDVRPGHSYFLTSDKGLTLKQKLDYELRPLLEEYRKDGILLEASRQAIADLSV